MTETSQPISSSPTWRWITPGHVLIALALAAFCFWQWQVAHDALLKAEDQIKSAETDRTAELATLQTKLEAIKHDQAVTKTPEQVIAKLPQYIPLPAPLQRLPRDNGNTAGAGQAPSIAIPPADISPLFSFATECQACKLKLQADQAQIAQLTTERDAALKAAKGGGFWRRTGTALKWLGIGVGVGVTVAKF